MSAYDFSDIQAQINEIDSEDDDEIRVLREILYASTIDHKKVIITITTLKAAHIYCVIQRVSAQQFGSLIQNYIIKNSIILNIKHLIGMETVLKRE
jgi:hypothetical protein